MKEVLKVYFVTIEAISRIEPLVTSDKEKALMSIFISSYFLLKDTLWHYSRCIAASKCRMQSNHKARVVIVREHTWYG